LSFQVGFFELQRDYPLYSMASDVVYPIPAPWDSVRSEVECLSFFKQSPFYSKTCNNENPAIPLNDLGLDVLKSLIGREYIIESSTSSPPELWIIKENFRTSTSSSHEVRAFYLLYGNIYQAPQLNMLIESRLSKATFHLQEAFDALSELKPEADGVEDDDSSTWRSLPGQGQSGLGTALMQVNGIVYMRPQFDLLLHANGWVISVWLS